MSDCAKVALVTGSTSGIGLAIAHALANKGVHIVITGFGDEETIKVIVNDIKSRYGVRVDYVAADLSKVSDIESLCSSVKKLHSGGIDILINNAGFYFESPTESFPDDKWDLAIAVMLTAPFQLIKRCIPSMREKGFGRIVNMSSMCGLIATPNVPSYAAVKHAIIGLTKGVALETAAHGITCNAVCPGYTQTPLLEGQLQTVSQQIKVPLENVRKTNLSMVATGKTNTPEQVAELVEFLCLSNASSQMTGASYLIDHGYTAK